MSKSTFKKFKKNDYSYEENEDEYYDNPRNRVNKKEIKRFERALKTKDITALIEDDDDLSEQEKQIIRASFLQEKHAFCERFNKLDTVLDMFSNIPGNFFSEKLKYAITVKTILKREENLPSYV